MAKARRKKTMSRSRAYDRIEEGVAESAYTKLMMVQQSVPDLVEIAMHMVRTFQRGKRIFLFGNGGSAADAQHIAAELEGRFVKNRRALPALALTTNTSTLTAVANDFSYPRIFSRQVEAHVQRGDLVLAISTSGNSKNVLEGVRRAQRAGATAVGFTSRKGGKLAKRVAACFQAPTDDTQRTQECHITAGHVLCDVVEHALFP